MSEIEKLYKLADAKPYKICNSCTDDNGNKITNSKNCSFRNLCGNACDEPHYILTAEKQIELIKFLLKNYEGIDMSKDVINRFNFLVDNATFSGCRYSNKSFEESLAGVINRLWVDMSEEEKQQVKGILE